MTSQIKTQPRDSAFGSSIFAASGHLRSLNAGVGRRREKEAAAGAARTPVSSRLELAPRFFSKNSFRKVTECIATTRRQRCDRRFRRSGGEVLGIIQILDERINYQLSGNLSDQPNQYDEAHVV